MLLLKVTNLCPPSSDIEANISPTSGVTYSSDLSGITAEKLKLYGAAISNNSAITNTTTDVYIDDDTTHIKMSVGSKKTMNIGGGDSAFVILGFNHDDLASSTYYGATTATAKAGITWQMENCSSTYIMNNSDTNVGGWTRSVMRTSTMTTLLNGFNFKDAVAPVLKKTSAGNKFSTINTDTDSLFLLSEIEIFGSTTYSKAGEGTQYAWYKAGNTKNKRVGGSNYYYWWERSPRGNDSTYFCSVDDIGGAYSLGASSSFGVAVGFCS